MGKTAIIIGSGVGGLATAVLLGKAGYKVTVLEKNDQTGGVAGSFSVSKHADAWQMDKALKPGKNSFVFDMGPSWYLMPDIFEHFFELLDEDANKLLRLVRLSPSYRVTYKDTFRKTDIYSDPQRDAAAIEQLEPGGGQALVRYLEQSAYFYNIATKSFLYKNYDSPFDFLTRQMLVDGVRLHALSNLNTYVGRYFKAETTRKLLLYPSLFLGSSPYKTPALYSIMSHADMTQGVRYPMGGMNQIVKVIEQLTIKYGVIIRLNTKVQRIKVINNVATGVTLDSGEELKADVIISNADIHHTETKLLPAEHRSYTEEYWRRRVSGPSALVLYLGVKGELPALTHHNLLFSKDWRKNFSQLFPKKSFKKATWPTDPSLYVCNPSKTDPSVAPKGHENLFVLVPVAANIDYTDAELNAFSEQVIRTLETEFHLPGLRDNIVYQRAFCARDFASAYNYYRGSALGLSHTLQQTAANRPRNFSRKVSGLYYVGHDTTPGIGLPTCLVSAELVYKRLIDDHSAGPLKSLGEE